MTSELVAGAARAPANIVGRGFQRRIQLQLAAVGLAFNSLAFKALGRGLLGFCDEPGALLTAAAASVALASVGLAFYLLPALGAGFIWLLAQLEVLLIAGERARQERAPVESGWVRLDQARDAALVERDAFWTERVERELAARARHLGSRRNAARQSFALLALAILDLACPRSIMLSLLQIITGVDVARVLLFVAYLLTALRWCSSVLARSPARLGLIYHPALAKHLADKTKAYSLVGRRR
jgi:hypothetical protein